MGLRPDWDTVPFIIRFYHCGRVQVLQDPDKLKVLSFEPGSDPCKFSLDSTFNDLTSRFLLGVHAACDDKSYLGRSALEKNSLRLYWTCVGLNNMKSLERMQNVIVITDKK